MYHSLETRICFLIVFLPLKESLTLFQIWVFCWPSIILSHLELLNIDLPKLTSSVLMEIVTVPVVLVDEFFFYMHHPTKAWLFEKNYIWTSLSFSYSLKITFILLRQVISLKKMVVLSVKVTISISWSPSCIPLNLISIKEICKYLSRAIV